MPEANPKAARAVADGKAPLEYLEPIADEGEARVLFAGANKYGRRNFVNPDTEMHWSTYLGSMRRHLNALHRGEDIDPDTGEHHLAHIRANTAVLLASAAAGTLTDDRLDSVVTPRSREVHEGANHEAKADCWVGPFCGHGTCDGCTEQQVEPFVVQARCCLSDADLDGLCIPREGGLRHGNYCTMGRMPEFS